MCLNGKGIQIYERISKRSAGSAGGPPAKCQRHSVEDDNADALSMQASRLSLGMKEMQNECREHFLSAPSYSGHPALPFSRALPVIISLRLPPWRLAAAIGTSNGKAHRLVALIVDDCRFQQFRHGITPKYYQHV